MKETNQFLRHQVEALKRELDKKIQELEENNHLLRFYEQKLFTSSQPAKPVKKLSERFPACYEPLPKEELSY